MHSVYYIDQILCGDEIANLAGLLVDIVKLLSFLLFLQILKPADKKKPGFSSLTGQGRPSTPPRNPSQQQKGKM